MPRRIKIAQTGVDIVVHGQIVESATETQGICYQIARRAVENAKVDDYLQKVFLTSKI